MYTIYHIPGIKVGCSKRVEVRVKEQGYSSYEVLEICSTVDEASQREVYWQKELGYKRDNKPYLKTIETSKLAHTEEAIKKRKETMRNSTAFINARKIGIEVLLSHVNYKTSRQQSGSHKKPSLHRAVLQYSLNHELIKKWDSIKEAGETLNIDRGNMSFAAQGKYKTAGGFIWRYVNP